MTKFTIRTIPVLILLLIAGAKQASAQGFSGYFGVGSAFDSSATNVGCPPGQIYDPLNPSAAPPCVPANSMGGVFGVFGGDFMFTPHLGFNGQYSFRFAQAQYATSTNSGFGNIPFTVRPAFYDLNAVYEPISGEKAVVPVLEGGIGAAHLSYYSSQTSGALFTTSTIFGTTNHFQVHGGVGTKIYFKGDAFIKPQFDIHYVPNLNQQYGRNFVPEFTVSIGYTFGSR